MKAQLKWLHSPDVKDLDLRSFAPEGSGSFDIFVQAMIGPDNDDFFESFDITVCSVDVLSEEAKKGPVIGLHRIVMAKYSYDDLFRTIQEFCEGCEAESWHEVGLKVGRLGRWEFEDYREAP